jgi:DNA-binding SARP family transcriptional activator
MESGWRIELFGGLRATRGDRVITRFRTQKTGALLAYLAYHLRRTHPREVLIELLWPEDDPDAARHKLSVALSWLRHELEPPGVPDGSVLVTERFSIGLNPDTVTTDVAEFEAALQSVAQAESAGERAERLAGAVELYQGALLSGYYEDWVVPEQLRLQELYCQAFRHLVQHFEQADDLHRAIAYAQRLVHANLVNEEAHRDLIRLCAAAGQTSQALRHYAELERLLKREFCATPSAATRALVREIETGVREAAGDRAALDRSPAVESARSAPKRADHAPRGALLLPEELEPVGGAVPLNSQFYVVRPADAEFRAAIARKDSIVLIKGARQVGKSSLLARGLQQAREAGARVVLTDFQTLNVAHLESVETLLFALAEAVAEQLDLDVSPAEVWDPPRGANPNFRRFLRREVLGRIEAPIVWGLDEVDRLFPRDFSNEVFGLFRAWHNERALDPTAPSARLTLAIAYATEAHLFITDLNQSPFNVGTRLTLEDFTVEQVADLNRRYGSPLRDPTELARFYRLVAGHPYLVRRGLHEMAAHGLPITAIEAEAEPAAGIFGDHLRRMLAALVKDPELCDAVGAVLRGQPCPTPEGFYRLRSAGVLSGESVGEARPRCQLYASYLKRHLL